MESLEGSTGNLTCSFRFGSFGVACGPASFARSFIARSSRGWDLDASRALSPRTAAKPKYSSAHEKQAGTLATKAKS